MSDESVPVPPKMRGPIVAAVHASRRAEAALKLRVQEAAEQLNVPWVDANLDMGRWVFEPPRKPVAAPVKVEPKK